MGNGKSRHCTAPKSGNDFEHEHNGLNTHGGYCTPSISFAFDKDAHIISSIVRITTRYPNFTKDSNPLGGERNKTQN